MKHRTNEIAKCHLLYCMQAFLTFIVEESENQLSTIGNRISIRGPDSFKSVSRCSIILFPYCKSRKHRAPVLITLATVPT